jgi:DNA-binding HxlR family transcriptional regulator
MNTTVNIEQRAANSEVPALRYRCPRPCLTSALSVIGGKWKALIVCELSCRSMRYHEIDAALCYISHRMLTYELKILMKAGVISRSYEDGSSRGHRYSLTTRGMELYVIIKDLVQWARIDEGQPAFEAQ